MSPYGFMVWTGHLVTLVSVALHIVSNDRMISKQRRSYDLSEFDALYFGR